VLYLNFFGAASHRFGMTSHPLRAIGGKWPLSSGRRAAAGARQLPIDATFSRTRLPPNAGCPNISRDVPPQRSREGA
jgi:hypothetical protein